MSQKAVTVVVDYKLGSTEGFSQAASSAEQSAGRQSSAYVTELKRVQGAAGKAGGTAGAAASGNLPGILGLLGKGGLTGLLGGSVYGAAGMLASDAANFGTGGPLMRGSGFIGAVDSAYGHLTGRGTYEAKRGWKIEEGQFQANQWQERMNTFREIDAVKRSMQFRPITEADPMKRLEKQRAQIDSEMRLARHDKEYSSVRFETAKGDFKNNRIVGMNAGREADRIVMQNLENKNREDQLAREKEITALATQRRDFEHQILATRKESIRDSRIAYGAATPEERAAAQSAAGRLKRGENLMPEEIGMLNRFGIAQQPLQEYLARRGDQAGFNQFAAVAGDEQTSDAAQSAIAKGQQNPNINIGIEAELGIEKVAAKVQDMLRKAVADELGTVKNVLVTKQDVEQMLRDIQNRQKTAFTR